ncbi:ATP-binding protein [Acidovorax lacteus]|uniref:endopeptidase La n=1 Tax=Acidovorax lacteus TaxID=1924988 RepID=A0ABP8LIP7_9BURK
MAAFSIPAEQLRLHIDPSSLGFDSTEGLHHEPLPWIGQERAQAAASLGLSLQQADFHLFVLGESGSGRMSLMLQAMHEAASRRPVPPDLLYLHRPDPPQQPWALRLPAGQGRRLRDGMAALAAQWPTQIAQQLARPEHRAQAASIQQQAKTRESTAFATLEAFAREQGFRLSRDDGQLVFTLLGAEGSGVTAAEADAWPADKRSAVEAAEGALRRAIDDFMQTVQPDELRRDQALAQLRRDAVQPMLRADLDALRTSLHPEPVQAERLQVWCKQVEDAVLNALNLIAPFQDAAHTDDDAEQERKDQATHLLATLRPHLLVDNALLTHAPVCVEDHPQGRSLFGSIETLPDTDPPQADLSCIHAGSLLQAHGGFLMVHLRDVMAEEGLWPRVRRFLRCQRLQPGEAVSSSSGTSAALQPEPIAVDVKLVLIGSVEEYYALQDADPDTARRLRIKVDFNDRFLATPQTRHASAVLVARLCHAQGLPPFAAGAVARVIEQSHRDADDQRRQSARFGRTEALVIEAANQAQRRGVTLVQASDVEAALEAQRLRHNLPEEELHESVTEGERLITLDGGEIGQINALTQIDLGDYRFGFPVRITARTFAGLEGLLNIEREVDMSGPIHDKGVLILHSYLTSLFGPVAPLALNASIVFEQEYSGVEGDSASCAEFYALMSCLAGLPLLQGIAVTGALNQHGEVLPVGGINEKIEGWFETCSRAGLTGRQGVLIPARNRRHLMLHPRVVEAVRAGRFVVHAIEHVSDGVALLTGQPSGIPYRLPSTPADAAVASQSGTQGTAATVYQRAEATLRAYRRACQAASEPWLRRNRS